MSAPTVSSRARRRGLRRFAPAVALLLVAVLVAVSVVASVIVARHFQNDARTASDLYARAIGGLNDPDPLAANQALFALGEGVVALGIPLVITDSSGRVVSHANLPFSASDNNARLASYIRELDAINPPVESSLLTVHSGRVPASGLLGTLAILQAVIILVMVAVAIVAYRSQTSARRDRLWVSMAREAAHQMGTPLTSLQGWIEQLRGGGLPPLTLAEHLDHDAERLQRVAQRFERIGNPARRDPVSLGALAEKVAVYYRSRLPRHANAITVAVDAPGAGPIIHGDPVLLEWAFEALVKNAADALQGRGGTIVLSAGVDGDMVAVRVHDDGPGVSRELRRTLFEPGVTTKRGGWGIGLALVRRVVEEAHGGTITLEPVTRGTTFLMRFPLATR
ncbi:MAG TPA: HAMP domain-containing sensor histidine kinase [Gemmatimonadales bacterium]|nr:HAMP domain-containing sensor histidine kinase [Gemmatimonadales bacterium]